MPQNTTIALTANTWTQVTDADVTGIRLCNLGTEPVWMQATAGAVPPTDTSGAVPLRPGEILTTDMTLTKLWPGVVGTRVYVYSPVISRVSVSHA